MQNFLKKFPTQRTTRVTRILTRTAYTKATTLNDNEFEHTIPFSSARLGHFTQPKPKLGNFLKQDQTLLKILEKNIPKQHYQTVEDDLLRFSERIASEIDDLGFQCEKEKPYVQTFDAWGNRVDQLVTCEAWKKMHNISAEEGLISLGYENPNEEWRRLHQMSKLYIFASSSGLYSCPLAMTDGAATIIRRIENPTSQLLKAFQNLTSRNPEEFWTSGQWMTEKKGGSDVASGTETVAVEQDDGSYRLHGYKWFSSATDSDMAFTLARVVDKQNNVTEGTKGLSLFYLETKKNDGSLNNIQIIKLKDKLGTRQLPTAELLLDGTSAVRAMAVSSEGLESFGGQGYIEETGLPNFLRDAQVLTIWEGTTNILSLDVLRCISKSNGQALISLKKDVDYKLSRTPSELLKEAEKLQMALKSVLHFVTKNQGNLDVLTFAARDLSYSLSRIYMGTLMIEHTASCGMSPVDIYACKRWCEQQLSLVYNHKQYSKQSSDMNKELVYG